MLENLRTAIYIKKTILGDPWNVGGAASNVERDEASGREWKGKAEDGKGGILPEFEWCVYANSFQLS